MPKQGSPWLVLSLVVGRREASWAFVTQCFSARTPPPRPGARPGRVPCEKPVPTRLPKHRGQLPVPLPRRLPPPPQREELPG